MLVNKKKKRAIKSSVGVLLLLIFAVWGIATVYVGSSAEKQVRQFFSVFQQPSSQGLYIELVTYKRSFFGGYFLLRLRSVKPEMDSSLKQLVWRADVRHGPLIFNSHNVQFALVHYHFYLDASAQDADTQELIERIFSNKVPFQGDVFVGYNQQKHYQLRFAALRYQVAGNLWQVSGGNAAGVIEPDLQSGFRIPVTFDELVFKEGEGSIYAMQNRFDIQWPARDRGTLKALFYSTLVRSSGTDYSGLSLNLDNLKIEPLFRLMEVYEARYNLDQQIGWTLEIASQYQEGQDKLAELYRQQDAMQFPGARQLLGQLFEQRPYSISFLHKFEHRDNRLAYNRIRP